MTTQIEAAIRAESWIKARELIQLELEKSPESHWLYTRLGLTHYEEFDYEKALHYATKALALAPECPLVLWDYAGALDMLGRRREAISIYRKLIARGVQAVAYEECGEGVARARGLLADCSYRLANCYSKLGDHAKAVREYKAHLQKRGPGCQSIYEISDVRRELRTLLDSKGK